MRSDFILTLIALGTVVCATYASPISSTDIQQDSEDDDNRWSLKNDLLSLVAKLNSEDDNSAAEESAGRATSASDIQAQFFRKFRGAVKGVGRSFGRVIRGGGRKLGQAVRGGGRYIKTHRRGIAKGLGRFAGGLIGSALGGGCSPSGGAPPAYPGQAPEY